MKQIKEKIGTFAVWAVVIGWFGFLALYGIYHLAIWSWHHPARFWFGALVLVIIAWCSFWHEARSSVYDEGFRAGEKNEKRRRAEEEARIAEERELDELLNDD